MQNFSWKNCGIKPLANLTVCTFPSGANAPLGHPPQIKYRGGQRGVGGQLSKIIAKGISNFKSKIFYYYSQLTNHN